MRTFLIIRKQRRNVAFSNLHRFGRIGLPSGVGTANQQPEMETPNPYQAPTTAPGSTYPAIEKPSLLNVLFSFNGRISRSTYWIWTVVPIIVFVILAGLILPLFTYNSSTTQTATEVGEPAEMTGEPILALILVLLVYVPLLWINLALQVKRWHDRDRSGWMVLISFVPIVSIWALIECGFLRGTVGPNQFGQDPT